MMTTKLTRIAASLLLACSAFAAQAADPIQVKIVSFNDFHGNLMSPGNFSGSTGPRRATSIRCRCPARRRRCRRKVR